MVDRKKKPPKYIYLFTHKSLGKCPRDCEYIPGFSEWDDVRCMPCDTKYVRDDISQNKIAKLKDKISNLKKLLKRRKNE